MKVLLTFKQQIVEHPYLVSFFAVLSALINFLLESWGVDSILFSFLLFLVGIDAYQGVKLAKLNGEYDYKVLKEKTIKKVSGYLHFLIALWIFIMMLFLMNLKGGNPFIHSYYLNVPIMTAILFFASIEFLSIKDKITKRFGIKTPTSIIDNIENFATTGGKDVEKLIEKQKQ